MGNKHNILADSAPKLLISTRSSWESISEKIKRISKQTGLSEQAIFDLIWQAVENAKTTK